MIYRFDTKSPELSHLEPVKITESYEIRKEQVPIQHVGLSKLEIIIFITFKVSPVPVAQPVQVEQSYAEPIEPESTEPVTETIPEEDGINF